MIKLSVLHSSPPVLCVVSSSEEQLICIYVEVLSDQRAAAQRNYRDVTEWAIFVGLILDLYA